MDRPLVRTVGTEVDAFRLTSSEELGEILEEETESTGDIISASEIVELMDNFGHKQIVNSETRGITIQDLLFT